MMTTTDIEMTSVSLHNLQMIDVIEGTTVNLKIVGNRVAFSIYGSVNSLNGDGEWRVSERVLVPQSNRIYF